MKKMLLLIVVSVLVSGLAGVPARSASAETIASLLEQVDMLQRQVDAVRSTKAPKVDLKIDISNAEQNSVVISPTIAVSPRPQGVAYWNLTARCDAGLSVELRKGLNFCRGNGLFRVNESTIGKKGSDHRIASAQLKTPQLALPWQPLCSRPTMLKVFLWDPIPFA